MVYKLEMTVLNKAKNSRICKAPKTTHISMLMLSPLAVECI